MSGWQDVLDQQLDLYSFWRTELGQRTAEVFGESMRRVDAELYGGATGPGSPAWTAAERIWQIEAAKLVLADPFYVDEDMMTLVEAAAETFKPEPLQESDLLTPYGFVVLPRPIFILDRNEDQCSVRAFAWAPILFTDPGDESQVTGNGIHLSLYSHVDDEWEFEPKFRDHFTAEEKQRLKATTGTDYQLFHVTPWRFGVEYPSGEDAKYSGGHWRPIQAFFRLTLQTVGDRYQRQPPRGARRRWARAMPERPKEDQYITVVRLRRPRGHGAEDEHHTIEWKQRWIVSGHWRNQWYPSLNAHRQVWISPYVKGPEDMPLLVRRGRAFELVR